MGEKLIAQNRKARHDYHVLERFEAGIALQGTEVKSLRNGKINLKDSFAEAAGGELYLVGTHISPYEQGNIYNHEPERRRKLLMHKREILKLQGQVAEKGLTLIPLRVYFKDGRAKVELGLCRGKNVRDKRDALKEKAVQRETQQIISQLRRRSE